MYIYIYIPCCWQTVIRNSKLLPVNNCWPPVGAEGIASILHNGFDIVWWSHRIDFVWFKFSKIVYHSWQELSKHKFIIHKCNVFFDDIGTFLLRFMFSIFISTKSSRSGRECSCQKPIACISSCITVPLYSHPLPIDIWIKLHTSEDCPQNNWKLYLPAASVSVYRCKNSNLSPG